MQLWHRRAAAALKHDGKSTSCRQSLDWLDGKIYRKPAVFPIDKTGAFRSIFVSLNPIDRWLGPNSKSPALVRGYAGISQLDRHGFGITRVYHSKNSEKVQGCANNL